MCIGETPSNESTFRSLLFRRFFGFYFLLFIFPFPLQLLPYVKIVSKWYNRLINYSVTLIGKYFFHISYPLSPVNSGSGDTMFNYIQLFLFVILAIAATFVYSIVKKSAKREAFIWYWLWAYIRLFFAIMMIRYGAIKIVKAQFPFPFYSLNETYGESSPLRLMINFMGYSKTYNFFVGAGEVLAGGLVLFRKTTTLGALLSIAILSNVVIMNFCYDVPVKIYATHLLFIAFFIAAPDAKRLYLFFVQNRTVQPALIQLPFKETKTNTALYVFKFVLTLAILYSLIGITKSKYYYYGDGAFTKTPLLGIYNVETFVKNRDTLQPLITDTSQWRALNIIYDRQATLKMMNDNMKVCAVTIDTANKKIEITDSNDSTYKARLSYTKPDSLHLALSGTVKKDSVYILLQKQNINNYELLKRGFHWINESPYKK